MSNSVSRIPAPKSSSTFSASKSIGSRQGESPPSDAFLKLVAGSSEEYRSGATTSTALRDLKTPLDRLARERVFKSIVRNALDNPEHPYYSLLSAETRRDMIQSVTNQLIASHYLTAPKVQG